MFQVRRHLLAMESKNYPAKAKTSGNDSRRMSMFFKHFSPHFARHSNDDDHIMHAHVSSGVLNMSFAVENFPHPIAPEAASAGESSAQPVLQLQAIPSLLEYRSESDPDAEFIPKTVAGFGMGSIAMGITLLVAEMYLSKVPQKPEEIAMRFAFMFGIACVSASLLLVGLKVRADHCSRTLYAKHWLNSIGTGAAFALLVWGPWALQNHAIVINRFLAAGIWMLIMTFPIIAAKWTIGPHNELPRPQPVQ
jgi:hypothetical protein